MASEILIVDDSATIRASVRIFLKEHPYTINEAKNGQEGVDMLSEKSFELVLTDLNMPVLDGFGLIEKARAIPTAERTPIIVMTTNDDDENIDRAFGLGASSYLIKPFDKPELIAMLARHLGEGS